MANWRKYPQEKPSDDRAIREILCRGIGGLNDNLHYIVCDWVWCDELGLHGFYYNGNEMHFFKKDEFEWCYVEEL